MAEPLRRNSLPATKQAAQLSLLVAQSTALERLLAKALHQVGENEEEYACRLVRALSKLFIRTTDQLKQGLETPECLEQLRSVLPGLLLPAVRAELKRDEHGAHWRKALPPSKPNHNSPLPKPLLRRFEITRADMTQLSSIDQLSQTFRARLFLILRIPGGAKDENLVKEFEGFPIDEDGRPTFRPSARWYLNQLDFPNGRDLHTLESKVTVLDNDLQLIKRIEGEFFEQFELRSFPFDAQDLTVTVSINCATEGPVPVEFAIAESNAQLGVDTTNFAFGDIWELSPSITPELTTVGATSKRRFPAVHLRACVSRRPGFVVLNVALPTTAIAFLAVTTFFVDVALPHTRIDLSVTILLTSIALKYATAAYLPQISYLTLVDRFVLLCNTMVFLSTLLHALLGMLQDWFDVADETLELVNKVSCLGAGIFWLILQLWFVVRIHIARNESSEAGQTRESMRRRVERRLERKASREAVAREMSDADIDPLEDSATRGIRPELSRGSMARASSRRSSLRGRLSISGSCRRSSSNVSSTSRDAPAGPTVVTSVKAV